MGIDDLVNQGKDFLDQNKDKIGDALESRSRRKASATARLDAAADFVKKVAPDVCDTAPSTACATTSTRPSETNRTTCG